MNRPPAPDRLTPTQLAQRWLDEGTPLSLRIYGPPVRYAPVELVRIDSGDEVVAWWRHVGSEELHSFPIATFIGNVGPSWDGWETP